MFACEYLAQKCITEYMHNLVYSNIRNRRICKYFLISKYISIYIREWIKISLIYSPMSVCQMMRFCWVRMVVECTEEPSFFLKSQMRMGNSKSRHRVSTMYSLYLPEQLTFSSSVMKLSEWNKVGVFECRSQPGDSQ